MGHSWSLAATKAVFLHLYGPVEAGPPPAQPAEAESSGEAVGPASGVGSSSRASRHTLGIPEWDARPKGVINDVRLSPCESYRRSSFSRLPSSSCLSRRSSPSRGRRAHWVAPRPLCAPVGPSVRVHPAPARLTGRPGTSSASGPTRRGPAGSRRDRRRRPTLCGPSALTAGPPLSGRDRARTDACRTPLLRLVGGVFAVAVLLPELSRAHQLDAPRHAMGLHGCRWCGPPPSLRHGRRGVPGGRGPQLALGHPCRGGRGLPSRLAARRLGRHKPSPPSVVTGHKHHLSS